MEEVFQFSNFEHAHNPFVKSQSFYFQIISRLTTQESKPKYTV